MSTNAREYLATLPIDDSKYALSEAESAFWKAQTGISDDELLKQHIISVADKAYKVLLIQQILALSNTFNRYLRISASDGLLSSSPCTSSNCEQTLMSDQSPHCAIPLLSRHPQHGSKERPHLFGFCLLL